MKKLLLAFAICLSPLSALAQDAPAPPGVDAPLRFVSRNDVGVLFFDEGSLDRTGARVRLWTLTVTPRDVARPTGASIRANWLLHEIDCGARTDRYLASINVAPDMSYATAYSYPEAPTRQVSASLADVMAEQCSGRAASHPRRVANLAEAISFARAPG